MKWSRRYAAAASMTVLGTIIAGCNSGGGTTCADYQKATSSDKIAIIQKVLKDQGKSTGMLRVDGDRALVAAYCAAHTGTDTISNAVGN